MWSSDLNLDYTLDCIEIFLALNLLTKKNDRQNEIEQQNISDLCNSDNSIEHGIMQTNTGNGIFLLTTHM